MLDAERADKIESIVSKLAEDAGTVTFMVLNSHEGKGKWERMVCYRTAMNQYYGDLESVLVADPDILPEDNAAVMFTSGMYRLNLNSM